MKTKIMTGKKEYDYVLSVSALFGYRVRERKESRGRVYAVLEKEGGISADPELAKAERDFLKKFRAPLPLVPTVVLSLLAIACFTTYLLFTLINSSASSNTKTLYFLSIALPGFALLLLSTVLSSVRMKAMAASVNTPYPNLEAIADMKSRTTDHENRENHH